MNKLMPLGDIPSVLQRYASSEFTPSQMVEAVHALIQNDTAHVWIYKLPLEALRGYASAVEAKARIVDKAALPLYGIPFAIKDNIDLAGVPTTAACPGFAYTSQRSATVVQRLIDAGAIPIGKTNLDQFATGLNGTRSPYGACRNAFNPDYISGGSSSGSAVAVAKGWVCFSLGTDTAGSGRVPAAFNNLIGYKPTGAGFRRAEWCLPVARLTVFPSLPLPQTMLSEFLKSPPATMLKTFIRERDKVAAMTLLHSAFPNVVFALVFPARTNCNSSAIKSTNGCSARLS